MVTTVDRPTGKRKIPAPTNGLMPPNAAPWSGVKPKAEGGPPKYKLLDVKPLNAKSSIVAPAAIEQLMPAVPAGQPNELFVRSIALRAAVLFRNRESPS